MRIAPSVLLAIVALFATTFARAAVESSAPDAFTVRHDVIVPVDAKRAFEEATHPERWWNDTHTWSGSAANLSLDAKAGGCWCERWSKGEAEHGIVVRVVRDESLRVRAAFGPLQGMGVNGVFDIVLHEVEGGTRIEVIYRVTGAASAQLDKLAAPVDGVIGEQIARLRVALGGAKK